MDTKLKEIAQKAFECQAACNMCFDACFKEDDLKMMADCIRLDRECADICALVATYASRESSIKADLIALCSTVCKACGAECGKHEMDHCQKCKEACYACAEACDSFA